MSPREARFTVAIIGRPNVGKSTLFNRLAGKRIALVDDTPGVTRDRREADVLLGRLEYRLIDTAGLEEAGEQALEGRMLAQTERAVEGSDAVLFVVDGRAGVTALDEHFAAWLRKKDSTVILVANKCEGRAWRENIGDLYALGFGEPIAVSAEHAEGLGDLRDALADAMAAAGAGASPVAGEEDEERPLQLAIVGRPNSGKSTLLNRLIGDERVITGPEPGLTRDAVTIDWRYGGRPIRLIDTAGLRRKARVRDRVERLSVADTQAAIRFADVVILLIDALTVDEFSGLERQDLNIAREVGDEGRALVLAINKWDRIERPGQVWRAVENSVEDSLAQLRGVPIVPISALEGSHLDRLMQQVLDIEAAWNTRVPTGPLNRWLEAMVEHHPPPMAKGRRLRIRYATQVKSRPPTFALFVSQPAEMPDAYLKYLVNGLREDFGLWGVPIRMQMRKGRNPYAGDSG